MAQNSMKRHGKICWGDNRESMTFDNFAVIPSSTYGNILRVKWDSYTQKCKEHFHESNLFDMTAEISNIFLFSSQEYVLET